MKLPEHNKIHKEILSAVQRLEDMGSVDSTDEYVDIMRSLIKELHSRINAAVANADGPKMSDKTREEVKAELLVIMLQGCFGDGMEEEYIYGGTTFDGLNHMTDKELAYMLVEFTDDVESLSIKAMTELGIEEMLGIK